MSAFALRGTYIILWDSNTSRQLEQSTLSFS